MSVDGVLISDVRRMCAVSSLPCCFLVTGQKGWGKTFVLRSFVSGMESIGGVVQADSAHCHASVPATSLQGRADEDDNMVAKETYRLRLLKYSNLDALSQEAAAASDEAVQDALAYTHTIYVADDLDATWSLCRLNGRAAMLTRLLGRLLRSRFCALVASATSPQRVPSLARTHSPVLLYPLPRLTTAAARRMLRVLRDYSCHPATKEADAVTGMSEVISGHECSRTMLAMAVCAALPVCVGDAPTGDMTDRQHMLSNALCWLVRSSAGYDRFSATVSGSGAMQASQGGSLLVTARQASRRGLYGLEEVYARLVMMLSILEGGVSHRARERGGCDGITGSRKGSTRGGTLLASLPCTTGVLLHGPSGCGKRTLTRRLAADFSAVSFVFVECTQLFSKYLGESEERLRQVYRRARDLAPAVVVLNNVDVVAHSRGAVQEAGRDGGKGVDVHRRMLAVLLCELDGVTDNAGVLTIGTSGDMHVIDTALLRQGRLETILYVPPLTQRAAEDMVADFFVQFDYSSGDAVEKNLISQVAMHAVGCAPVALHYVLRKLLEACLQDGGPAASPPPPPPRTTVDAILFQHASVLQRVGMNGVVS